MARMLVMTPPAAATRRTVLLGLSALALTSCAGFRDPDDGTTARDLGHLTYRAVDDLLLQAPPAAMRAPFVVSSLTDTQHLDHSSRFGNIVADFARTRLAQRHVTVSEYRLRSAVLLRPGNGEMALGRDAHALSPPPPYAFILAGDYGAGDSRIYVTLKLISAADERILAAVDFVVWRTPDIAALL